MWLRNCTSKKRGEKWILKGDSNTPFFHKCANGRKRKSRIISLEDGERVISDDEELRRHITDYYKILFGQGGQLTFICKKSFGVLRKGSLKLRIRG